MKLIKLFFTVVLSCTILSVFSQTIIECDSINSYLIIQKDSIKYAIQLNGKVKTTDKSNIISVNKIALQYIVVNKNKFKTNFQNNDDLSILSNYAKIETDYLSKIFKTNIDVSLQKISQNDKYTILFWYYKMPKNISNQVLHQLYVNIILDDYIIGFSSPQFSNQSFESVRDFLINTMTKVNVIHSLNNLCN